MSLSAGYKLIIAFVALIIGVVLLGVVSTNVLGATEKSAITNEAVDISSGRIIDHEINQSGGNNNFTLNQAPLDWKRTECPLTTLVYNNGSDDLTLDTDYQVDLVLGVITVLNTTTTIEGGNDTLASYTYCQDGYLTEGWSRSVLNLTTGFFAIALLLVSIGLFFTIGKDLGMY